MVLGFALAAVLTVVPEEGAALEGGYRQGLKDGLWLRFEQASPWVSRAERYEAGWLVEELDLLALLADLELVEPRCAGEQVVDPPRLRAEFRRVLERWAPAAVTGGLWEALLLRGGGEAHALLRFLHRLAHRRFSGSREGEEDVGRPEATARFLALRDHVDRWLLSADGPRSLRSVALMRVDFPADQLATELSREVLRTLPDAPPSRPRTGALEPRSGVTEEARLVFAQWCRISQPAATPPLEAAVRAWYTTTEALWRSGDDPSVCAARALARWGGEDNLTFLIHQVFHGFAPARAAEPLEGVLGPRHAALVRRSYQALGEPDTTNPELGFREFSGAALLEWTGSWALVAGDLRSRDGARVLRALRFVPRTRAREVTRAFDDLLASPGDEAWRSTAKAVKAWRDQLLRRGAPQVGVAKRVDPFPPVER